MRADKKHFFISADAGYALRLGKLPDDLNATEKKYYTRLKKGTYYQLQAGYYFDDQFGVGISFSSFYTHNKIDNVTVTFPNNVVKTGVVSDKITINKYGAACFIRSWNKNLNGMFSGYGGLAYYTYDDKSILVDPVRFKGNTIGVFLGVNGQLKVSPEFLLGIYFTYDVGLLTEYTIDDGVKKEKFTFPEGQGESLNLISGGIKGSFIF